MRVTASRARVVFDPQARGQARALAFAASNSAWVDGTESSSATSS